MPENNTPEGPVPGALRLADSIDQAACIDYYVEFQTALRNSAAELRRQHARIAELESQLSSSGFSAADMATAAAQGFRDGVASVAASAGSEPVAHLWQHSETGRTRVVMPDMVVDASATWLPVGPLYLHPSPPEGMVGGWMPIETAPKDGRTVIVGRDMGDFGFVRGYGRFEGAPGAFRGGWISHGFSEHTGDLGLAHPTHWMPLPPAPSSEGESNV